MAGKGFDLVSVLKDVSKLDPASAGREQIEYIEIGMIDSDPANFYKLSDLKNLAANIEVVGLQQPLRVRTSTEDPQRVIVVSGHRRLAALQELVKEGKKELESVPCIRERAEGSAALQELRLIYANSDTRQLSPSEASHQAERVEILLYQLKEEGFAFPGKMRDHVAQACRMSAPKLARLKVIREKLITEYRTLFDKDKLTEQAAYALARLPEDFQRRMLAALPKSPDGYAAERILRHYNEGMRWEPDMTCPDGTACRRGDAFLRRDCEASSWHGPCGGKRCCLTCSEATTAYSPCERMCSKAKAQRKAAKDEKEAAEYRRRQKEGRKYQKETQSYAKRLLRAIDAAGLPDEENIRWEFYADHPISHIRQWAAGEFDDPATWTYARLTPGKCNEPVKMAQKLGCSTDFLMGLTEDIRPAAAQTEPEEALEKIAEQADSWDELADTLAQLAAPEETARCIRWEDKGRTPPECKPILTYQLTNNGPVYRPAVWDGTQFKDPAGRKELTGLQYTSWLEIPVPGSGEVCHVEPPEQAEGQLTICGWMPGGTNPADDGDMVADFRIDERTVIREVCYYHDGNFCFSESGAAIDAEVIRWMRLPPVSNSDTPEGVIV